MPPRPDSFGDSGVRDLGSTVAVSGATKVESRAHLELAGSVLRGTGIAFVGPLAMAASSPGDYWYGDIAILFVICFVMGATVTACRYRLLPSVVGTRGSAIDIVVVGAMTLPLLIVREVHVMFPDIAVPRLRTSLAATVTLATLAFLGILRRRENLTRVVAVVSIAVAFMAAASGARIGASEVALRTVWANNQTIRDLRAWDADSAARNLRALPRPDVFLLILDSYAGDRVLQADYGIDHSQFRRKLDSLGFMSPDDFRSNYSATTPSVSSILNFEHVVNVGRDRTTPQNQAGVLNGLITDSRIERFFRAAGYDIHWVPAPFFGGRGLPPREALVHRRWRNSLRAPYTDSYLVSTWLERVWLPGAIVAALAGRPSVGAAVDSAVALLPRIAADGRPSFVVVHLLGTHEPLSYDATCRNDPSAVSRVGQVRAYEVAVRCVDERLLEMFRQLVSLRPQDVIIVAIGDHAPAPIGIDSRAEARTKADEARFEATAQFYLPPSYRSSFRQPKSAVNVFPAILNAVFGLNTSFRPDSQFVSRSRPAPLFQFESVPR